MLMMAELSPPLSHIIIARYEKQKHSQSPGGNPTGGKRESTSNQLREADAIGSDDCERRGISDFY